MSALGRVNISDLAFCPIHSCRGCPKCAFHPVIGPAIWGASQVYVNGSPALRLLDFGVHLVCCGANMWVALSNVQPRNVIIEGKPAFCVGDITLHCGKTPGMLVSGSPTVFCGQGQQG
jgi:uncharacterized Zn-binding protein involved in type VI secretion